MTVPVVVSGGQTGVDRAALEVARELGLPVAGWCPAGGWAEDLPEPPGVRVRFPELRETPSADPAQRTRWNVRDSDAVLVLVPASGWDSPGTRLTVATAAALDRPRLLTPVSGTDPVREWLAGLADAHPEGLRLDVAGPRESESPGIGLRAATLLRAVLQEFVTLR